MIERADWNASWFDRTAWIFEHLEDFHLEAPESLVVLVLNYLNTIGEPITMEKVCAKTSLSFDAVDEAFESLSAKGYLTIDTSGKSLHFVLEGLVDAQSASGRPLTNPLIQEFTIEFGRPLSSSEMQRIVDLCQDYSEDTIIHALDEAAAYNKRSVGYVEAVLSGWKQRGLSEEDIESGRR